MNKKIVLTSCGIINEVLKKEFYKLLNKEIEKVKENIKIFNLKKY